MAKKIIMAFTGRMASGKGSAAQYFIEKHGAKKTRFSDMLRDILDRLYLEHSRENMQSLSTMVRKTFAEDVMARTMMRDVQAIDADLVVIDGARRKADVAHLRTLPNFHLVAMDVPAPVRFERIKQRNENSDDRTKSWEKFQEEEKAEAESLIDDLMSGADYTIDNNCSMEELRNRLEAMYQKILHES